MKLLNIYVIRVICLKYTHLNIYTHFHLFNIKVREIIKTHFLIPEYAKRQTDGGQVDKSRKSERARERQDESSKS